MMVITMCVCYLFYNSVRSTVSCLYLMFVLTHLTFVSCSLRTFEFVYDSQLIGASRGETIHPERFWPVQANAGTVFRFYFSDCQIAFKSKQAVPGSSSWGGGGGGEIEGRSSVHLDLASWIDLVIAAPLLCLCLSLQKITCFVPQCLSVFFVSCHLSKMEQGGLSKSPPGWLTTYVKCLEK